MGHYSIYAALDDKDKEGWVSLPRDLTLSQDTFG
jgi:hypothetical protein